MKKTLIGITGALSVMGMFLFGIQATKANPSFFIAPTKTATATTTRAYITNGTATTTLSIDAYANGNGFKTDEARVDFQITATGTAPVLLARVEHSDDNVDWYSETIETTANTAVTTYAPKSYSYTFASSSAFTITTGTTTRMNMSFYVDTPQRYTRVIFYSTSANPFDLWAQIQPMKEHVE